MPDNDGSCMCYRVVPFGQHILVFGGAGPRKPNSRHNDLFVLDLSSKDDPKWRELTSLLWCFSMPGGLALCQAYNLIVPSQDNRQQASHVLGSSNSFQVMPRGYIT